MVKSYYHYFIHTMSDFLLDRAQEANANPRTNSGHKRVPTEGSGQRDGRRHNNSHAEHPKTLKESTLVCQLSLLIFAIVEGPANKSLGYRVWWSTQDQSIWTCQWDDPAAFGTSSRVESAARRECQAFRFSQRCQDANS